MTEFRKFKNETHAALAGRMGIDPDKDPYERAEELYEINRMFQFKKITADEFSKLLDDWWKKGLDE